MSALRPIGRLVFFFLLFVGLLLAGQLVIGVLTPRVGQWASYIAATAAALIASWIVLSRVDGRPFGALGFPLHRAAGRESLLGMGIGAALIGAAVLLLLATRTAAFIADAGTATDYLVFLGWTFLFFGIAATLEEVIFRGYPFQVLVEWLGPWPAVGIASILFSLLHLGNPNVTPLALVNIFLAGVLLSIAYLRTRSLWFATGVHVGWNWMMAGVLDFPVSGLAVDTPVYTGRSAGQAWWTGGDFGPEAGLVGTLVLLVGSIWLLRTRLVSPAPEMTSLCPLVDSRLESGNLA